MKNRFNINEEEKNRIRGLHLTESKDLRFTSVLNEQEYVNEPTPEDNSKLKERFAPIKGEEFTGVSKHDLNVPNRMRVQTALEAAEDDVINNIFEKIGGTVVSQPTFLGDMTVKWEDGTEDTFFGRRYWEDISEHEEGSAMTGKFGEIWVDKKTGEEVKAPKWINKEHIINPFRAMKKQKFLKKHEPIQTSTVTYKVR